MPEKEFQGWGHQGWPTVWEVIATQSGFTVLMESNGKPVIMEASYGNGKFIMMSLAPDKYHIAGKDDNTKKKAGVFMENLMTYLTELTGTSVDVRGKLATVWSTLKISR